MIHTATVTLAPSEVLARAKRYFAERVPNQAAFVEKEGPQFVALRGQGGEEVVISATPEGTGDEGQGTGATSRVRASTLFFDQALDRFFSTLPVTSGARPTPRAAKARWRRGRRMRRRRCGCGRAWQPTCRPRRPLAARPGA